MTPNLADENQRAVDDGGADASVLTELPAFRAFQAGASERCIEPPQRSEATIVGSYRMVGK